MFVSYLADLVKIQWASRTCQRGQWHPTPVLLPGKSHGQRSLVRCSPWGRWGLDTTERLPFHFSLSCIGEGNGNPLQCSCLENPRDGGAWWAAVYGVAQSRTRLKWLSSSSYDLHIFLHLFTSFLKWKILRRIRLDSKHLVLIFCSFYLYGQCLVFAAVLSF